MNTNEAYKLRDTELSEIMIKRRINIFIKLYTKS